MMMRESGENRLLLLLLAVLAGSALLISPSLPLAHAQFTGLVCITTSTSATSCPTSPPTIGPLTHGTTFRVGVFVQNSDPLGGWDMYVAVNPAILNPTSASLGSLITSPTLTSICINGAATTGSCTVGTANGPGVVEVTTIESSGLNDCSTPPGPCSGLAFSINYTVVGSAPSTPIFFPSAASCSPSSVAGTSICVLIANNVGNPLPENIQGATITQAVDPTSSTVACTPSTIVVGTSTSCMATVTDTAATGATNPTGTATFMTDASGSFSPSSTCSLSPVGTSQALCSVTYTPSKVGTGTHHIGAAYSGDLRHAPSVAPAFSLSITLAAGDFSLTLASTSLIIPAGSAAYDVLTVASLSGFTGSVTLANSTVPRGVVVEFVPNPAVVTSAVASATSNIMVLVDSTVVTGTSFNLIVTGTSGFLVHTVSVGVAVTGPMTPTLVQGKIHWTHHISLSKVSAIQVWTAMVGNPLPTNINVLVRVVGLSAVNPSLGFDITCGTICVNTVGSPNSTPGLAPVSVLPVTKCFAFTFNWNVSSFINQKVAFTATLYWTTGTFYNSSNSKSGSFVVAS